MSVRMRHTSGHTRNRRSHHALGVIKAAPSEKEGALRLPHRLDEATGMYRGRQIAPAKATPSTSIKVKGPDTEPAVAHVHEHAHADHVNAEAKSSKGVAGKVSTVDRPRSRSGMGGGS